MLSEHATLYRWNVSHSIISGGEVISRFKDVAFNVECPKLKEFMEDDWGNGFNTKVLDPLRWIKTSYGFKTDEH